MWIFKTMRKLVALSSAPRKASAPTLAAGCRSKGSRRDLPALPLGRRLSRAPRPRAPARLQVFVKPSECGASGFGPFIHAGALEYLGESLADLAAQRFRHGLAILEVVAIFP